jgi:aromatic ring-opening dioxygenase catalytic subunit (LigB family)
VPFRLMFNNGKDLESQGIPVVEASIDSNLKPEAEWKLGQAVQALRKEGVLVLSGGLPIHNLRDFKAFSPDTAGEIHKSFHQATIDAITVEDVS